MMQNASSNPSGSGWQRHRILRRAVVVATALVTSPITVDCDQGTAQAAHPVIPAFERFFRAEPQSTAEAGRLLLGELNCTSCHVSSSELVESGWLTPKQAPRLDSAGTRLQVQFLRDFLSNPQSVKPGATMPHVFARVPEAERQQQVESLVHFLASTGSAIPTAPSRAAIARGEKLFHSVGCVACHNSQRDGARQLPTSVPLGRPENKYTLMGLAAFLRTPHEVRPSGRMPNLNLTDEEALDVASYLMRDADVEPNLKYMVYEGNWQTLPDFSRMQPRDSGGCSGFDLTVARKRNNFGIRFTGYLQIPKTGEYTFWLGSDDGGRLTINGQTVIDVDGIHPYQEQSRKLQLEAGPHALTVDYFQGGGEWILRTGFAGPGISRRDLASAVSAEQEDTRSKRGGFQLDDSLVEQGRQLFTSVGCARCHQLPFKDNQLQEYRATPQLGRVRADEGCLASEPPAGIPDYSLDESQKSALLAAIGQLDELRTRQPGPEQVVRHTMQAFNCYACHARSERGGVEQARNPWFSGSIPEMGDEGRIPPLLDGAGDKLTDEWLKHVMDQGAKDRPYMAARMPKFGAAHVGSIVDALVQLDRKPDTFTVEFSEPPHRVKSAGRFMVGDQALSCVKCHNFSGQAATGIQSVDLTTMTRRLRRDWFVRYMINPQVYRPGTRMPSAWPNGFSILPKVLEGDTNQQLAAIWLYLEDGPQARTPQGIGRQQIELIPASEPIIYRNFIEGLGPRGIAVGYPEKAHLAFDAEMMCVALIWHNAFIDAGKHWIGRGPGNQTPLGDHLFSLGRQVPLARLENLEAAWPTDRGRNQGFAFLGYRLDDSLRPVFRYRFEELTVEDHPVPQQGRVDFGFRRTLTFRGDAGAGNLWFRAATADTITELEDGWYLINNAVRMRHPEQKSVVRRTDHGMQLLVPIRLQGDRFELVQEIDW